ncbi:MAG: T9SS type A sorting domain-containing protein [Bacteroidota bacterium]|nr:T9SS type A sorting domain-containing protein [Bacteroidota bacterium]
MSRKLYLILFLINYCFFSFSQSNNQEIQLKKFSEQNNLTPSEYQYLLDRKANTVQNLLNTEEDQKSNSTSCFGNNFTNIGFELGNFNGWTVKGGVNYDQDKDSIVIGAALPTNTILSSGVDAIAGYVLSSPLGGNKIAKLNDNFSNAQATLLETKFRVTNQTSFLKTAFALVFQNATHYCTNNPYFKIEVFNCNKTVKLQEYYTLIQENACVGEIVLSNTVAAGYWCTDWRVHCFDFSNYLNSTITLKITMSDCSHFGHFGYGYFDAKFEPAPIGNLSYNYLYNTSTYTFNQNSSTSCVNNSPTITLPSGASNYSCYSTYQTFTSTSQSFVATYSGNLFIIMPNLANNCIQQEKINTPPIIPTITVSSSTSSVCPSTSLTVFSSGASIYTIIPGPSIYTSTNVNLYPSVSTIYTISGSYNSCTSPSQTIGVYVYPTSPISITPISQTLCLGSSATISAIGANTYTWNNGQNTSSIIITPTVVSNNYFAIGHDVNGCSLSYTNSSSLTTIITNTVLSISSSGTICPGDSLYVNSFGASVTSYSWSNGSNLNYTYLKPTSTTIYTVFGTTACGILTNTVSVFVKPVITTTLSVSSPSSACEGSPFTINSLGATSYTYIGANTSLNTGVGSINLSLGSSNFTVLAKSALNCSSTSSIVTISILPKPSFSLTPPSQTVCIGQPVTFSASPPVYTYSWTSYISFSFNTIGTGSVITFTPTYGFYFVNAIGANGCNTNSTVSVSLESPISSISTSQNTLCLNATNPITLTPNYLYGSSTTYTWNTTVNSISISVTPTVTTTYTLESFSSVCGYTSAIKTITVYPSYGPTITAVSSASQLCVGQPFTLTAMGANQYVYPGCCVSSNTLVTSVLNNTVSGNISVYGFDLFGCKSNTVLMPINVVAQPTINWSLAPTICAGKNYTLTATGSAASFSWNTGATSPSIVISPTVFTSYTVYAFSSNNACSTNMTKNVYTYPQPTINISPSLTNSICVGQSKYLTETNSYNTYNWSNGTTANSTIVSPSVATVYTLTVTDYNNCQATGTVLVGIYNNPTVSLSILTPSICINTTTSLTAIGSPTGGVFTPTNYPSINFGIGSHSLIYKYTNPATTCTNVTSGTFTVYPAPCVTIFASQDTMCVGQTSMLYTSPLGGGLSGAYLSGNNFNPLLPNDYNFIYTYIDNNNCVESSCTSVFVDICTGVKESSEMADISIYPNPFNSSFKISNSQNKNLSYQIIDVNGKTIKEDSINKDSEIEIGNISSGIYMLKLFDNNNSYKNYKLIKN